MQVLHNGKLLIINMKLCVFCCSIFVAGKNTFADSLMLVNQIFVLAHILDVFKTVTVHLLRQIIYQLHKTDVTGSINDDVVESNVFFGDTSQITGFNSCFEINLSFFQRFFFFICNPFSC